MLRISNWTLRILFEVVGEGERGGWEGGKESSERAVVEGEAVEIVEVESTGWRGGGGDVESLAVEAIGGGGADASPPPICSRSSPSSRSLNSFCSS